MKSTPGAGIGTFSLHTLRNRLLNVSTVLVLLWAFTLWWGERLVFQSSVSQCYWNSWESWQPQAQPHHVLLVADPQLVDPHTYPDRPWPLSSLTILYTDIYLRRSYKYLQDYLRPDATLFLGDLFDGGREWATAKTTSPEQRYRQYGTIFWLKEYVRFSKIFLKSWVHGSAASAAAPMGRRIIASVPGNHDLGFANGIQPEVKSRFDAYFGPLNRVDVLGNHTIVSLDTVSLSAMDQADLQTGSSGAGDGSAAATVSTKIWKPAEDFLASAKRLRAAAVHHECRSMNLVGSQPSQFDHDVVSLTEGFTPRTARPLDTSIPSSQFPTIVLSHVPLFRSDSATCGPMRERGTAIPLSAGYQYQNVLTPLISHDIVKHLVAEEIVMIYSGDDHDYCEIEHSEFTGRIKEITVKSMSWAMGVRKPGVQLVSLWNPIDVNKISSSKSPLATPKDTVQNHLCLLPDQLSIFIRYAQVLMLTLIVLIINAIRFKPEAQTSANEKSEPLLPLSHTASSQTSSASASPPDQHQHLSTRAHKLGGYGNLPASSRSSSPSKPPSTPDPFAPSRYTQVVHTATADTDDWANSTRHHRLGRTTRLRVFGRNVWRVAWPVLLFYVYILWNG